MASRSLSLDSIILRTKEVPSGARVATLLTNDGIEEVFVFGGGKSKLRSLASPWHYGKAFIYSDKAKNLLKLTDFDSYSDFETIRTNLDCIATASFASEFLVSTSLLGGENSFAFELFKELLFVLNKASALSPKRSQEINYRAIVVFIAASLTKMGLYPERGYCETCSSAKPYLNVESYSRISGGFICQKCSDNDNSCILIEDIAFSWLSAVMQKAFSDAVRTSIDKQVLKPFLKMHINIAKRASGNPLYSLDLLDI